jgi:predicted transcriptional regulator
MTQPLGSKDVRRPPNIEVLVPRTLRSTLEESSDSTITLHFAPEAAKRLRELASSYAHGRSSEVVRKALHFYDWCKTAQLDGASLWMKSADGRIRKVHLP